MAISTFETLPYPDRGVLALPQVAQRGHAVPDALRLARRPVHTTPRELEVEFELLQRVSQRGQQGSGLVLLGHPLSLLSCVLPGRTPGTGRQVDGTQSHTAHHSRDET